MGRVIFTLPGSIFVVKITLKGFSFASLSPLIIHLLSIEEYQQLLHTMLYFFFSSFGFVYFYLYDFASCYRNKAMYVYYFHSAWFQMDIMLDKSNIYMMIYKCRHHGQRNIFGVTSSLINWGHISSILYYKHFSYPAIRFVKVDMWKQSQLCEQSKTIF